ncbi:MAG: DUF3786 domain-containing protein [Desulfitobacterium sp.]|nr:DUF3786 domain-containing protein [Desulfitobacterium sp.]
MKNEELKKYRDALAHSQQEFAKRSLEKMIELTGARAYGDSSLIIPYRGEECLVTYPAGDVSHFQPDGEQEKLDITDKILILQYLTEVCGVSPQGKWISFRELPAGENHYNTFKLEAMEPLAKRFGKDPEGFAKVCEGVGGKKISMGDIAYSIEALPKLELAFILWLADDEFPAQANILFDAYSSMHLNTEGLEVMAGNTAAKLIAWADRT